MARFDFNVEEYNDFEGGGSFEPIPEGEYEVICEEAEEKQTQSGGTMIKAKFRVLGPTHANRVIYNNFNIVNKSEKAQEIGRRQLSTWARAVGKPNASDTDELLNLPFIGVIGVEEGDAKYGPQNRFNGFKSKSGNAAPVAAKPAPKPAAAPASTPSAKEEAPAANPAPAPASPSKPAGSKKAPWD